MIFTDENGVEFEWIGYNKIAGELENKPLGVLIPVKQQPKWEFDGPDSNIRDVQYFTLSIDCSKDQAQLIKQSVEALMEYITADGGAEYPYENKTGYQIAARAARQSMRENN